MKLNALILAAAIFLGFLVTWYLESATPSQKSFSEKTTLPSEPRKKLPVFSVTDLEGRLYHSSDFAGKTILINFWATWCPPCIEEFPRLLSLARAHPDDLILLALSSDQDTAAIRRFTAAFDEEDKATLAQENVILVHDAGSKITFDIFETEKFPETLIVAPSQEIVKRIIGVDWDIPNIEALIAGGEKRN